MNHAIRDTPLTRQINADIIDSISKKKLSDKKLKDFMKSYYDGDPSVTCPAGCKADCLLDCYIEIHQSLIDDTGKQVPFKQLYKRDSAYHCCGKLVSELGNGKKYCTVCGGEYK